MTDKVRCKFVCASILVTSGTQREITLRAQYDNTIPEDQAFTKYTPSGEFKFTIDNPAINDFYVPGQAYYLDLVPVPAPVTEALLETTPAA